MDTSSQLRLLLTGIVHPMLRLLREEFKASKTKPKLTFTQFRILNGIRRGRDQVGKLSEFHGISQPAMSKMVDGLVKSGFIKRVPHSTDRRQIELRLTQKGAASVKVIEDGVFERIGKRIAKLGASDQKAILDGISRVSAVLAEEG